MAEILQPVKLVHVTTVPETLFFLVGQVARAKAMGMEIHAVSSPGEMLNKFGEQESVQVHAVDMPRRITPINDLRAVWAIRRVLRSIQPHVVHAHTPKGGLLAIIAAWLENVPIRIYHIHGLPLTTATGYKRVILRNTERTSCGLATRVISVSNSIRDVVLNEGLCPRDSITVLRGGSINGIDADEKFNPKNQGQHVRQETRAKYGIPDSATVIGFIGRIVRDKGLIELTQAWRWLREQHKDLHMLIIGPWEPQDPVPVDVEQTLRNDPRIHLVGMDWNTPPLYAAMDIVVLPTYREGFPTVPLEAAAMELPIVATRVPGCIDAVQDGITGILVPAKDADALCTAIDVYISNPDLRAAHGHAARERVLRDYKREDIWDAVCNEYARLLDEAGIPLHFDTANTER
ncbi:MAG: glycosyltransferase family 4 protein [Armatimonadota bacterium]|nr:glycosyltransferase family 4 protein [bacterium]